MTKLTTKERLTVKGAINELQLAMLEEDPTHSLNMAAGAIVRLGETRVRAEVAKITTDKPASK